jgi:hypothetical protein
VLFLLLHFSVAVSRLTDQTKVLAQRLALLEQRQREAAGDDESDQEFTADAPSERPQPVPLARRPRR